MAHDRQEFLLNIRNAGGELSPNAALRHDGGDASLPASAKRFVLELLDDGVIEDAFPNERGWGSSGIPLRVRLTPEGRAELDR